MKPHPRIRKTIKWGGAVVTVLLVSLPFVLMGLFVLTAARLLQPEGAVVVGIALSCVPYLFFGVGALVASLANPLRRARLWMSLPAVGVGVFHSAVFINHVQALKAPWGSPNPPSISADQATGLAFVFSSIVAITITVVWCAVVLLTVFHLASRRARLNLCPTGGCNYDRTGLAIGAKCPECGAAPVNS